MAIARSDDLGRSGRSDELPMDGFIVALQPDNFEGLRDLWLHLIG
jgi:hypothetical protein